MTSNGQQAPPPPPPEPKWGKVEIPSGKFKAYEFDLDFLANTIQKILWDQFKKRRSEAYAFARYHGDMYEYNDKDHKELVDAVKEKFLNDCTKTGYNLETCERPIDNGVWLFCQVLWSNKRLPKMHTCKNMQLKKPALPTPPPPTLPPPTTEEPTTTAAPFPIIPTIGAFFGGFILAAIVSIVTFIIWKKKKAKKAGMPGTPTKSKTPTPLKSPAAKTPGKK